MSDTININQLLEGHVTLEVDCLDRIYLNGYIPSLATGGQMVAFLKNHLGNPIPSPALLGHRTKAFVERVKEFAQTNQIPIIHFQPKQRKDDLANDLRKKRPLRDEVVFIGVAQEKAKTFSATKDQAAGFFLYEREKSVCVNHYYFYIDDEDFGPLFIKICSYAPYSIKVCLNGREWAKRQMEKLGIEFDSLDNGFLSFSQPERLQQICDSLSPEHIGNFFNKWLQRLPLPLSDEDRRAGYDWQLSIWQMEVSLTQVFDRPVRGREFFEATIKDNLDLGRPDRLQLIFDRKITRATPGRFRTRVIYEGVNPSLHIEYKNFDLKQYYKEGRALRTESTFRNPKDFGVNKGLDNLSYLQQVGSHINRRLLEVERVSHNCGLSSASIQKVVQPTVAEGGEKAPGLKFGDPRVMALFLALTMFVHLINGFRNRDLREPVAQMLGKSPEQYSSSQMSYDLKRLRRKGIIYRDVKKNRYHLTPYGWKVARLMRRLEAKVFRPAMVAIDQEKAELPPKLKAALEKVDAEYDSLIEQAIPAKKVS